MDLKDFTSAWFATKVNQVLVWVVLTSEFALWKQCGTNLK